MLTCIAKIKDLAYGRNIINLGLLIIFIAWFLTPLQDYFHAIRNQHAYYISESLLFATFWFWIIPVSLFVLRITWLNSPKINFFTKISVFVISSFVLHLLAYALFVYGISYFFYQATYDIPKILSYSLSNDFYKYIIIYGMIGYYFLSQQAGGYIVKNNYPEILTVGTGRSYELIAVETICYISSASPYVSIHTQGRKYLQLDSLRAFGERLNPDQFVRVHKSAIVNLRMLKSIKSRLNGDYDLVLRNGHQLRMSRNYVSDFRKSFKMNSSPQHNITSA